jgi:hypothetical protein
VVLAYVARRAFAELSELCTFAWSAAQQGSGGDEPRGYLQAMQAAFALALTDAARAALEAGDAAGAMGPLSALICLDPPSRVSRAVHELRRAAGASGEVLELIGLNERLVKYSDSGDASFEGVVAAVNALSDAMR